MFVFVCYYRVAGVQGREVLPPATKHKAKATYLCYGRYHTPCDKYRPTLTKNNTTPARS